MSSPSLIVSRTVEELKSEKMNRTVVNTGQWSDLLMMALPVVVCIVMVVMMMSINGGSDSDD